MFAVHESGSSPSRHIALPHQFGREQGKADVTFVASRRRFNGYTPYSASALRKRTPNVSALASPQS